MFQINPITSQINTFLHTHTSMHTLHVGTHKLLHTDAPCLRSQFCPQQACVLSRFSRVQHYATNQYPSLQYSCQENLLDRGARGATVHGVTESDTIEQLTHQIGYFSTFHSWKCLLSQSASKRPIHILHGDGDVF